MIFSNSFMSASEAPGGGAIMSSNALRFGTSISATTVQYCSAQKSVMIFIFGMPTRSLNVDIAKNFSTIGRTLPGLQYMMSRTRYIAGASKTWGIWTMTALEFRGKAAVATKHVTVDRSL